MIRAPRGLFRARKRGDVLHVGPVFIGKAPNYSRLVDELIDRNRDRLTPGTVHEIKIYHDDSCSIWSGGACDCRPDVKLAEAAEGGN